MNKELKEVLEIYLNKSITLVRTAGYISSGYLEAIGNELVRMRCLHGDNEYTAWIKIEDIAMVQVGDNDSEKVTDKAKESIKRVINDEVWGFK